MSVPERTDPAATAGEVRRRPHGRPADRGRILADPLKTFLI